MKQYKVIFGALALLLLVAGCKKEESTPEATFTLTIENVTADQTFGSSGVFDTPVGAMDPGGAGPGSAYEFTFNAGPGDKLSFATMFVESNDLFFGPDGDGIELYTGSTPNTGDITSEILLWDAGTEVNEAPGTGANQPMRQSGPNTGTDENGVVQIVNDGFTYPSVSSTITVTLNHLGAGEFMVRIDNLSGSTTPIAPGVWGVHSGSNPLFEVGTADWGRGLEALAEDGNAATLGTDATSRTGLVGPMAPGVYAVHDGDIHALFENGQADFGEGLEALAEDGDPSGLSAAVAAKEMVTASGVFNTPTDAASAGPIFPGQNYSVSFVGNEGDHLSFATMMVQSNDLFFAPGDHGIELFSNGSPVTGDITTSVSLWDGGTEVNENPGTGWNQAPRQAGANTGTDESVAVQAVSSRNDGFSYPAKTAVIRVTLAAQ